MELVIAFFDLAGPAMPLLTQMTDFPFWISERAAWWCGG